MSLDERVEALFAPLLSGATRGAVAFDADGTLWSGDVGEDLLLQLASDDRLPAHPGGASVYADYERRVGSDPANAFAFATAALAGWDAAELEEVCTAHFQSRFTDRIFPFVRELVPRLVKAGVDVWIVSASPVWSVRPGARALGLDPARVIAAECRVVSGRITSQVVQPLPTLEGKPAQLRARGVVPEIAAGNSLLDVPMLEAARAAFVVAPGKGRSEIKDIAQERGWPVQRV